MKRKKIHPEIEVQVEHVKSAAKNGDGDIALEYANTACRIATQLNDGLGYDVARLCVAVAYTTMDKLPLSISIYQEVWESIEANAPEDIVFWMYYGYVLSLQSIGDWENSFLYGYKGIELAKQWKSEQSLMQLSYTLSLTFERLGEYSQSMSTLDTVIELARKLNDNHILTRSLNLYAKILVRALGDKGRARDIYKEILDIITPENHFLRAVTLTNLATIHPEPESEEAGNLYSEALTEARQTNIHFVIANGLHTYGNWYVLRKNYGQAKVLYEELLGLATSNTQDSYSLWLANISLAKAYFHQEQYDTARQYVQTSLQSLSGSMYEVEKRDTYQVAYTIERASNNGETALQYLEKVYEMDTQLAAKEQEESAKTALISARVDKLYTQLEETKQRTMEMKDIAEQQNIVLLATTLELEQKNRALQKIKKIATRATEKEAKEGSTERNKSEQVSAELRDLLQELRNNEDSWEGFQQNLERLYPQFIQRLMKRCPELSSMQIRICSLLRLQLSSKEIAETLRLSKKTVDNHREHIRIKLNIPRSVNLVTYILYI
jgi:DNA-binding CsgD family transcriptional regulator